MQNKQNEKIKQVQATGDGLYRHHGSVEYTPTPKQQQVVDAYLPSAADKSRACIALVVTPDADNGNGDDGDGYDWSWS